jgi:hypothetical protein
MKKILLLFFVLGIASCQDNFDEINDTLHRSITLQIETDNLFSDILAYNDGNFYLGADTLLKLNQRLRVVVYCYDNNGTLQQGETRIVEHFSPVEITMKHLLKNENYTFIIMADVVEYDSYVGYYETWYQLETASLEYMYMTVFNMQDEIKYNSVIYASLYEAPSNQTISVRLSPITYNGFVVLTNTSDIYHMLLTVTHQKSCYLSNIAGKDSIIIQNESMFPNGEDVVVPVTTNYATNILSLVLTITDQYGRKSEKLFIYNDSHRPFIAKIDCKSLSITNVLF